MVSFKLWKHVSWIYLSAVIKGHWKQRSAQKGSLSNISLWFHFHIKESLWSEQLPDITSAWDQLIIVLNNIPSTNLVLAVQCILWTLWITPNRAWLILSVKKSILSLIKAIFNTYKADIPALALNYVDNKVKSDILPGAPLRYLQSTQEELNVLYRAMLFLRLNLM